MIFVKVKQGNFNLMDESEVGYSVTVNFDGHRLWVVLDRPPMWSLPSDLINEIEEYLKKSLFHSRRDKILGLIELYRENQGPYDAEWCEATIKDLRGEIAVLQDRINAKEKVLRRLLKETP